MTSKWFGTVFYFFILVLGLSNLAHGQNRPQTITPADQRVFDTEVEDEPIPESMARLKAFVDQNQPGAKGATANQKVQPAAIPLEKMSFLDISTMERETVELALNVIERSQSPVDINEANARLARILLLGARGKLLNLFQSLTSQLSLAGDPSRFQFAVQISPYYDAAIISTRIIEDLREALSKVKDNSQRTQAAMELDRVVREWRLLSHGPLVRIELGLLAEVKTIDELAGLIAHEMVHENARQFELLNSDSSIESLLQSKVGRYGKMSRGQQEELRADIGAVDRLVKAGYNPMAYYDLLNRFLWREYGGKAGEYAKARARFWKQTVGVTNEFVNDHPTFEVRLTAVKAYIGYLSEINSGHDIPKLIAKSNKQEFPLELQTFRMRAGFISSVMRTVGWVNSHKKYIFTRGVIGLALGYTLLYDPGYVASLWNGQHPGPVAEVLPRIWAKLGEAMHYGVQNGAEPALHYLGNHTDILLKGLGTLAAVALSKMGYDLVRDLHQEWSGRAARRTSFESLLETLSKRALMRRIQGGKLSREELMGLLTQARELLSPPHNMDWELQQKAVLFGQKLIVAITADLADQSRSLPEIEKNAILRGIEAVLKIELPKNRSNIKREYSHQYQVINSLTAYPEFAEAIATLSFDNGASLDWASLEAHVRQMDLKARGALLFQFQHALNSNSPELILRLLERAKIMGFTELARRLMQEKIELLYDHATQGAEREVFLRRFREIYGQLNPHDSPKVSRWTRKKTNPESWWIYQLLQRRTNRSDSTRWADLAFTKSIWYQEFSTLEEIDSPWATSQLQSKASVSEMHNFLQNIFAGTSVSISGLSGLISSVVVNDLSKIKTQADIDIMLSHTHFWREFSVSGSNVEAGLLTAIQALKKQNPELWRFEPSFSGKVQAHIIQLMRNLGTYPSDLGERVQLWLKLTQFGITTTSDLMWHEIYNQAKSEKNSAIASRLEEDALKGRVWEAEIRARLARERVFLSEEYRKIKSTQDEAIRIQNLREIIKRLWRYFPAGGGAYVEILEELSKDIESSPNESRLIFQGQKLSTNGRKDRETTFRTLSEILTLARAEWTVDQQWEFLKFLRGDIEATPFMEASFKSVGVERPRRMFQMLPDALKIVVIAPFMNHPQGLLPDSQNRKSRARAELFSKRIMDHFLKSADKETKQVIEDVISAFSYAMIQSNTEKFAAEMYASLIALPAGDNPPGVVLRKFLEGFGSLGVKIGQFLYAANVFPPEVAKHLEKLHNETLEPVREEIYQELRKFAAGKNLNVKLHKGLGFASMKWTVLVSDLVTFEQYVLSVLRDNSMAGENGPEGSLKGVLLKHMVEYLAQKNRRQYGILRAIYVNAVGAVKSEQNLKGESHRSAIARQRVYIEAAKKGRSVRVPFQMLIADRLVSANFISGVTINQIKEEFRENMAIQILEMETDNLWQKLKGPEDLIFFDPDRHPGNILLNVEGGKEDVGQVDFGQLEAITGQQRDQVVKLFALSDYMKREGASQALARTVLEVLGLSQEHASKLHSMLKVYFPNTSADPLNAYYGILTALHDIGLRQDRVFFSFARAVVQIDQYKRYISQAKHPRSAGDNLFERAQQAAPELEALARRHLSGAEKMIVLFREKTRARSGDESGGMCRLWLGGRK